jgi:hypothetical protein
MIAQNTRREIRRGVRVVDEVSDERLVRFLVERFQRLERVKCL